MTLDRNHDRSRPVGRKKRTAAPGWDDLQATCLDRLQAAGAELSGIDCVVNTHPHFDHVGWHTRLTDGAWQSHPITPVCSLSRAVRQR